MLALDVWLPGYVGLEHGKIIRDDEIKLGVRPRRYGTG
jgi:hypothetical protein